MSEKMTTPMPCPFCGNEARKISTSLDERFGYALEVSYGCPVCGFRLSARGDSSKGGYADNHDVEEAALRKWNARIDDASREAATQAAVEAERKACAEIAASTVCDEHIPTGSCKMVRQHQTREPAQI